MEERETELFMLPTAIATLVYDGDTAHRDPQEFLANDGLVLSSSDIVLQELHPVEFTPSPGFTVLDDLSPAHLFLPVELESLSPELPTSLSLAAHTLTTLEERNNASLPQDYLSSATHPDVFEDDANPILTHSLHSATVSSDSPMPSVVEEPSQQPIDSTKKTKQNAIPVNDKPPSTVKNAHIPFRIPKDKKIRFWGASSPPLSLKQKYTYVKSIGGEGEALWVRVLNLKRVRRTVLAKKFMSLNHLFHTTKAGKVSDRRPGDFAWYDKVQKWKASQDVRKKYNYNRRVRSKRTMEPLRAESEVSQSEYSMSFPDPQDSSSEWNSKERIRAPFETLYDAAVKKNRSRVLLERARQRALMKRRLKRKEPPDPPVTMLDKFKTARKIKRTIHSVAAREAIVSSRLGGLGRSGVTVGNFKLFTTTLRHGVYRHDWALVSKCCEALVEEIQKQQQYIPQMTTSWAVWNGAFLSLINTFKNDFSILMKTARLMRTLKSAYPRRIGIDVATWLMHKGEFVKGTQFLEEIHESIQHLFPRPGMDPWWRLENPRKSAIDFVAELFTLAKQYGIFKQNLNLHEQGLLNDSVELYSNGEFLLNLFQLLEKRGEAFNNDSTVFIEQFVEVALKLRGPIAAKEIYDRISEKNPRNDVLTELYVNFLLNHFPNSVEEIEESRKKLKRYDFSFSKQSRHFQLAKYNKFRSRLPGVSSFKRLEDTPFSR